MSVAVSQQSDVVAAAAQPTTARSARGNLKLAYIVSRFPKPTETFVLSELEALRERDVPVEVFPLLSLRHAVAKGGSSLISKVIALLRPSKPPEPRHDTAAYWQARARYAQLLSFDAIRAVLGFVVRHPIRFGASLGSLVFRNIGSLRYLSSNLVLFPRMVQIARDLERMRVTHVHAHFANSPAAAALTVHRLTGLPFSFTAHGSDLHRDRHMLKQKIQSAAFVVCISEFNRQWALKHSSLDFAEKTKVVHCGVQTDLFAPESAATNRASDAPLRILQVGTLHEVKGQTILLQACAMLVEQGVAFECEFVGEGPDFEKLSRLAEELGLADKVVFHGYCPPSELRRLLAKADVLACPSVASSDGRREGIPVVLMEAMASGVPVVASRLSGIPELVECGSEGLLFEPGEPAELASALAFISESPDKASRFAKAARRKVLEQFDQRKNIDLLLALFEETRQC